MLAVLSLLAGLVILVGPFVAIAAMNRSSVLGRRVERLERDVEAQTRQIAALSARLRAAPEVGRTGPDPSEDLREETPQLPFDLPHPSDDAASSSDETTDRAPTETPGEGAVPRTSAVPQVKRLRAAAPASDETTRATPVQRAQGVEEALASRWIVWLGAVAVALSAVFLFSYAIEQGWLGPWARVGLGLGLGASLILAGEWVRRESPARIAQYVQPDYVPPALAAAGVFALFASVYAGHGLYGLFGSGLAFAALAAVSFAGLALALRHGLLVASLALAGGYLVPLLVASETPQAAPMFLYLAVLTAACLGLMRFRNWPVLAVAATAGAFGWPALWLIGPWTIADQTVLSAYAIALAVLFALLSVGWPVKRPDLSTTAWLAGLASETSGLGFVLSGGLTIVLALVSGYNQGAFLILGLYAGVGMGFGLRRAAYESLAVASALVVAVAFLLWPEPETLSLPERLQELGVERSANAFGPFLMPPELAAYARSLAAFGAFFGLGGVLAMRVAATPGVWAALAAAMPLSMFTLGYWRIGGVEIDPGWAGIAGGMAFAFVVAAGLARRWLDAARAAAPLSFLAAGATAALALAFVCLLREAWLTVALSLQVPALVWIWARLRVKEMRALIYATTAVVVARLVLNPSIIDYEGGALALFGWVLYGYGIPAVAFLVAGRWLRRSDEDDTLATVVDSAAVAFGFLMVAFQARIWTSGALSSPSNDLFDQSVQTLWWLVAGGLLLRSEVRERLRTAWYGGVALLGCACLQLVFGHLIIENPLRTVDPVGEWPLVNLLGLAYLAPSLILLALSRDEKIGLRDDLRPWLRMLSGAVAFVFVSLEVRRAFAGPILSLSDHPPGDAEIYAYSVVWLLISFGVLAYGILRQSKPLRYAALGVLVITVLKVFLYDMSDLTGLLRVASFLGLGLSLIGIGWVYRAFVFVPSTRGEGEA